MFSPTNTFFLNSCKDWTLSYDMIVLRQMLIPTFNHLFPGKTMILVADNAPYHRSQGEDGAIKVNTANRPDLIEWLEEKCDEVDVDTVKWERNKSQISNISLLAKYKAFHCCSNITNLNTGLRFNIFLVLYTQV